MKHHRHEKRLRTLLDKRLQACLLYKATPPEKRHVKPELLFEMEMGYCIICNAQHWILGNQLEMEKSDPKDYTPGVDRRMENWIFARRF